MAEPNVLIDSSVWIEGLSPKAPQELRTNLRALIEANQVVVTEMIRLEVIAGAKSFEQFKEFRADFEALRCLETTPPDWRYAEELCFGLSRRGFQVTPTDALIASVAISRDVPLWHADKDFERIKHVMPELHTFWYPHHTPAIR